MSRPYPRLRRAAVTVVAVASAVLACTGGLGAARPAASGHPAGQIGSPVVIARAQDMSGDHPYDVATDARTGTAYIGWIGSKAGTNTDRTINLCTLPLNASSCTGGVQSIPTDGVSTADNLRVLATASGATLVWFHNTANSVNGPEGGAVAEATAAHGLNLTSRGVVYPAPSNGSLVDAEIAPGGALWALTYAGVGTHTLQLDEGTASYKTLRSPFYVGQGQLAFAGKTAVIALTKYGAVSTPASFAYHRDGGSWSSFRSVAKTWTTGGLTLVDTARGLRLVTTVNDASYRPVLAKWNGSGFDRRILTADHNNCGPSSHDGATDPSGRLVDASWECNDVTIANYADGTHAALVRISVAGTPTYTPQVGESTRGIATVAWTVESPSGGSVLRASRVRLAAASRTVVGHAKGGAVRLTGPVSCLPPSNARVAVSGVHARGWKLLRHTLTLGSSSVGSTIDGSTLTAGKTYTLHGTATFGRRSARSVARVELTFSAC